MDGDGRNVREAEQRICRNDRTTRRQRAGGFEDAGQLQICHEFGGDDLHAYQTSDYPCVPPRHTHEPDQRREKPAEDLLQGEAIHSDHVTQRSDPEVDERQQGDEREQHRAHVECQLHSL